MNNNAARELYIKVICEACNRADGSECIVCGGARFYFWDPQTLHCYSKDGTPITALDEDGERLSVTRRGLTHFPLKVELKVMVECIELWVREEQVRKWNLTFDETGWQACLWINRYKKICFEFTDENLEKCVAKLYQRLFDIER